MKKHKIFLVKGCMSCPNLKSRRIPWTSYAFDYFCGAYKMSKVAGYVETPGEEPKDHHFPDWCPLEERR